MAEKKYQQVYTYILQFIHDNSLRAGDRLPTERELEEALGVSVSSVHRAMNQLIAEDRVYKIQGSGSYVKGPPVKESAPGGIFLCPLILADNSDELWSLESIQGAESFCKSKDIYLTIHNSNLSTDEEGRILENLYRKNILHAIISPNSVDRTAYQPFVDKGMRLVFLDYCPREWEYDMVETNNYLAARQMCAYLFEKGHRRIGVFFVEPLYRSSGRLRCEGVRDYLREQGLEVVPDWFVLDEGYEERIARLMRSDRRPTAFVGLNDGAANALILLLNRLGYRVPEDVSVTGFDGLGLRRGNTPLLTGIRQPFYQMGYEAARLLYRLLNEGEGPGITRLLLPAAIQEGETVRALAGN